MNLSETQQDIFNAYTNKKNVFLTGPGGCGKSYLIKHIVNHAKENNKSVRVCAMTGCAAILLECNAKTVHSWAGIGLANGCENAIIGRIMNNMYKKRMWTSTQILIVDEVSMMSKRMFELLDSIGKCVRNNARPFGGIQLIFSGDFYQLPPVNKQAENLDDSAFCFESLFWKETFDYQFLMDQVFRQTDETYISVLHQIREGKLYKDDVDILNTRLISNMDINDEEDIKHNGVKPVMLLPTKFKVNTINQSQLDKLPDKGITFKYKAKYEPTREHVLKKSYRKPSQKQLDMEENILVNNALFEKEILLKKGCQVMCICNLEMEAGLCNGSTGIINDFDSTGNPRVQFSNGLIRVIKPFAWVSENVYGFKVYQIPLILAWAVTIHKSQGATLECAEIDIGNNIFAHGQTYVALSRVKSLDGLYLRSFNHNKITSCEKVGQFYEQFYEPEPEPEEVTTP